MKIEVLKKNSNKGFSLIAGINRDVIPSHVTKLANSIDAMGVIRPVVTSTFDFLDGQKTTYIIDGQHLYMACLRLNIDVPYVEIEIDNVVELVEKIALLNASSKSWTLPDYIKSWKVVNKDYITLQSLFERYDIELSQIAQILHLGYTSSNRWDISRVLKSGSLEIKNLQASVILLDRITDVLKVVPRMDRSSNHMFINAFSAYAVNGRYNHVKTIQYLKDNRDKVVFCTQDPEEYNKLFHAIK